MNGGCILSMFLQGQNINVIIQSSLDQVFQLRRFIIIFQGIAGVQTNEAKGIFQFGFGVVPVVSNIR